MSCASASSAPNVQGWNATAASSALQDPVEDSSLLGVLPASSPPSAASSSALAAPGASSKLVRAAFERWSSKKRQKRADADFAEQRAAQLHSSNLSTYLSAAFCGFAIVGVPYLPKELVSMISDYAAVPSDARPPYGAIVVTMLQGGDFHDSVNSLEWRPMDTTVFTSEVAFINWARERIINSDLLEAIENVAAVRPRWEELSYQCSKHERDAFRKVVRQEVRKLWSDCDTEERFELLLNSPRQREQAWLAEMAELIRSAERVRGVIKMKKLLQSFELDWVRYTVQLHR
jgi:hypothetical protein